MVRILLLRHFPVITGKSRTFKFGCDPDIKYNADVLSALVNLSLICTKPDKIISSPYLRCRKTASRIIDFFEFGDEIEIDKNIGEFHPKCNKEIFDCDKLLYPETLSFDPILYFDEAIYKQAVKDFLNNCQTRFHSYETVIIVTHSFFLTCICTELQYSRLLSDRPNCISLTVSPDSIQVEEFDLLK